MVEIQLLFEKCSNCTRFSGTFVSFPVVACADYTDRSRRRCEAGTAGKIPRHTQSGVQQTKCRVRELTWGKIVKAFNLAMSKSFYEIAFTQNFTRE